MFGSGGTVDFDVVVIQRERQRVKDLASETRHNRDSSLAKPPSGCPAFIVELPENWTF